MVSPSPLESFGEVRLSATQQMQATAKVTIVPIEDERLPKTKQSIAAQYQEARWLRRGEPFQVRGVGISGGLFFVGEALGSNKWQGENCLVRPSLSVTIGRGSDDLPYYPNYSQITPAARGAYLQWLATARDNPSTEIGLVFLYFYGLEYRLFQQSAIVDRNEILDEVERLLRIYGGNRSFSHYAQALLIAARVGRELGEPTLSLDRRNSELPMEVRYWLGLRISRGEPLSARDALCGWPIYLTMAFGRQRFAASTIS